MKVSVIIPVYNTEQYLSRCIESILNQSFSDFELLLVDDGSTDGSGAICDAYAEKDGRVRVFHKDNGGVGSARNFGMDNAKGEWLTFIDSDDYIEDDYFPEFFNPEIDLYMRGFKIVGKNNSNSLLPQIVKGQEFRDFLRENAHLVKFRTVWGCFFKRQLVFGNGICFETRFRLGEDTLFMMEYYRVCNSLQVLGGSLYIWNRNEDRKSKYGQSWNETEDYLNAFMERYDRLEMEAPQFVSSIFMFFYEAKRKWALSEMVLRYKKTLFPYRGFGFKMKYYLAKTTSALIGFS